MSTDPTNVTPRARRAGASTSSRGSRLGQALAALLVAAGSAAPAGAVQATATPSRSFTVVSGAVQVRGGEATCFRISDTTPTSDRIVVRIRFTGTIPRGHVTLDGARSAAFNERSEEFAFVVDPRGTHRLELRLDERATIDWLSVASTESTIVEESCASYEFDSRRRVDLATEEDEPVNRFETEEERRAREREAELRRQEELRREDDLARRDDATRATGSAVVPAGTEMSLTLQNEIDTRNAYVGQNFSALLDHDVVVGGRVAIPQGTRIEGHVVETQDAGRFGRSNLKLGFDRAVLRDGTTVPVRGTVQRLGKGSAAKQGGIIAGSAIGGAILGKVLGGDDKDALLGAIVGGGIAAGSIAAKEGESIVLPSGSVLAITLDESTTVPAPRR